MKQKLPRTGTAASIYHRIEAGGLNFRSESYAFAQLRNYSTRFSLSLVPMVRTITIMVVHFTLN